MQPFFDRQLVDIFFADELPFTTVSNKYQGENLRWLRTLPIIFICKIKLEFNNKKWGSPRSFLFYKHLKMKLRSLTGYTVSMVNCFAMIMTKLFNNDWAFF